LEVHGDQSYSITKVEITSETGITIDLM
jgi:hypothetical protein